MKKFLYIALILISLALALLITLPLTGKINLLNVFLCGTITGMSFVALKLNNKNDKINSYKRELEKESISADESSSKVKVLEQKIEVLEKALENALKNKKD